MATIMENKVVLDAQGPHQPSMFVGAASNEKFKM